MKGLNLAISLLNLVVTFFNWMVKNGHIKSGEEAAFTRILRGQADDLDKKLSAMADAGKRFDDAKGMPPDIKFRD